ncbi:uncharacterized protein atf5b [Engraulis encrasicolus]|uniref:uncharacterized protein atf5b n=1 Tax=Engraulis encrasicolus TaxID=184585 RepID=UPI002FCFC739
MSTQLITWTRRNHSRENFRISYICLGGFITPPPQRANDSQSQEERGEEPQPIRQIIGEYLSDWMTEKEELCSFSPSSDSSHGSSIPSSPLEHDVQVPSDLHIMTSLLQEELSQFEDYFLSDFSPAKVEKWQKSHKSVQGMDSTLCYEFPYASHSPSQSETTNPLLVSLGELDQVGFCGGPIGRPKMLRPAAFNNVPSHYGGRRVAPNSFREGMEVSQKQTWSLQKETWTSKESYSGFDSMVLDHSSVDRTFGKSAGSVKKVKECAILLKEEENYCFRGDVFCSVEMAPGYCVGSPLNSHHAKKDSHLMPGMKNVGWQDRMDIPFLQCSVNGRNLEFSEPETAEEYFYQHGVGPVEPCSGFMDPMDSVSVKGGGGGIPPEVHQQSHHRPYHECLGESFECVLGGDSMVSTLHSRPMQRPKDKLCSLKAADLKVGVPLDGHPGERKQKKRDQNKTAAHRYRQRKRAELDSLEAELQGLEGQNRALRDKAESVEREIQYVKDLLIEVYKARSQRIKDDISA